MDILERLREILHEIDEDIDVENLNEDSNLIDDVGMTSVSMLYMSVALENNFGVDLTNASLNDLKTVGDVIKAIENK